MTQEQVETARIGFVSGVDLDELAKSLGVTYQGIWYHAQRKGWKRPVGAWKVSARKMFEDGVVCRLIGEAVGVVEKTVETVSRREGWKRLSLRCYKCGEDVPPSKKKNSADKRVCVACAKARQDAKKIRHLHLMRSNFAYRSRHLERRRITEKRPGRMPVNQRIALEQEWSQKREQERARPTFQRARFVRDGEPPHTREGALLILKATFVKFLEVRCEQEGVNVDTIKYRARYQRDPAFRAKQKAKTAGQKKKRGVLVSPDGSLTPEVVRRLFATTSLCPYCTRLMRSQDKSLDHMEPVSRGGLHVLGNVTVCCKSCNSRKRNKPYERWLNELPERRAA